MIDRQSPVPVYYQIEQYIEEWIKEKNLQPGDRVPSEREWIEKFNVSRMTIRQAVMDLVNAGVLVRLKGKGTFVSEQYKIEKALNRLNGFTEDMLNRGMKPDSELLDFRKMIPPDRVAEKLSLSPDQQVFAIKRIRSADQRPMAIETTFIPVTLVPELTARSMGTSLYDYIEKKCRRSINHAVQSLEAALLTSEEARLLDVSKGSPVLIIERIGYFESGEAFEWTKSLYRADRYKFVVQLPRN